MELRLHYGHRTVSATYRYNNHLQELKPKHVATLQSAEQIIESAFAKPIGSFPLRRHFHRARNILIVVPRIRSDRALQTVLPFLVNALNNIEVPDEAIRLLIANETQPALSRNDVIKLLGPEIVDRLLISQHDCHDTQQLEYVGETKRGTPLFVNKLLLEVDQIILCGPIEHHFAAGFSGGPGLLFPGCAGIESIFRNRALGIQTDRLCLHDRCHDGNIDGNPLHEDLRDAYRSISASFAFYHIVNVAGQLIAAFSGHPLQAYLAAGRMIDTMCSVPIGEQSDLTIVSCGGYPNDRNFVKAYPALRHATYATRKDGTIILLAACSEGVGSATLLEWFNGASDMALHLPAHPVTSETVLEAIATHFDANQYHIIAVSNLPPEVVRRLGFSPARSLQEALDHAFERFGGHVKTYILPEGLRTVPTCHSDR